MKKTLFISTLALTFAFTSCKNDASKKVNEENVEVAAERDATADKFPVMTFEEKTYDFGTVEQGTHVEHLFTFTNTGDADLIISNAKGSCGCTVPEYPKEPIAPGETGEMLVKFNGSGKNQRTISVTIDANTKTGKERLTIKAFVEPKEGSENQSGLRTKAGK